MFFGEAIASGFGDLMATHPPVRERLARIYGRPVAIEDILTRSAPADGCAVRKRGAQRLCRRQ